MCACGLVVFVCVCARADARVCRLSCGGGGGAGFTLKIRISSSKLVDSGRSPSTREENNASQEFFPSFKNAE